MRLTTANDLKTPGARARAAGALAGIALLAACSPAAKHGNSAAATAVPPTAEEALATVESAEATFTSGNAEAIMAHYAPGAVFFDASIAEPTDDRATATKWTENFVAMKPSNLSTEGRKIQILDADTFIASGIGTLDAVVKGRPTKLSMRYTDVYEKQADGRWLIVHEHLSMPPKGEGSAKASTTMPAAAKGTTESNMAQ